NRGAVKAHPPAKKRQYKGSAHHPDAKKRGRVCGLRRVHAGHPCLRKTLTSVDGSEAHCGDDIGVEATARTELPRRRRLLESKHIPGLIMVSISSFSQTAALMGDLARASMLTALMDGRALTAAELARVAGIAPQTASGHLGRLVDAGLI